MTVPHPQGPGSPESGSALPAPESGGRGLIIAGSVLLAVAMVVGIVGFVLTVGRIDVTEFQRDIVAEDGTDTEIPGAIEFRVFEPLGENDDGTGAADLRVGIGVSSGVELDADCTLFDESDERIPLLTPKQNDAFWRDNPEKFSVVGSAKLAPGAYTAECTDGSATEGSTTEGSTTEGSDGAGRSGGSETPADARFTVGRVAGPEDYATVFTPALWFVFVAAICGLTFLIGLALLVFGLSKRASARRAGPQSATVQFPQSPPGAPSQPFDRPAPPPDAGPGPSGPPQMPPHYSPPEFTSPPTPDASPSDEPSTDEPAPAETDAQAPSPRPAPDGWTIPPSKKQQ